MKSEKGVTIISVTIYVIGMLLAVTVISVLTGYFYTNIDISSKSYDISKQYTKFNSYFTEEVNKSGNTILDLKVTDEGTENEISYILFSSGKQYTFIKKNKGIYIENIKIATNIDECKFEKKQSGEKTSIIVQIIAGNYNRTTSYILKK